MPSSEAVHLPSQDAKELLPEGCPSFTREFEDSASRRLLLRDVFFRLRRHLIGEPAAGGATARTALVPQESLEGTGYAPSCELTLPLPPDTT